MKILAIETSCDETAAAIVSSDKTILSHHLLSQLSEHKDYGGVVPEIAARAHMLHLEHLIKRCLEETGLGFGDLDGIAVTAGPGLIGGVIVGVMMAKAIASVSQKPLIAVNHLEGHALTVRLTENIDFPFLLLLVSGGHCQVLMVEGVGRYKRLGATLDDALGEAFDKVAKMLGLGYPGGPIVERLAKEGDGERFTFPRSLKGRPGCDFSFSGLKTAVKREIDALGTLTEQDKKDICASFQAAVTEILVDRLTQALEIANVTHPNLSAVVIAGGVAANQAIRQALQALLTSHNKRLYAPPLSLCTDNAAMIGWAGLERLSLGLIDDLTFVPRARWPLEALAAAHSTGGAEAQKSGSLR